MTIWFNFFLHPVSLTQFFLYANLPLFLLVFFNYMCKYLFHSTVLEFFFRYSITRISTLLCLGYKSLIFSPIFYHLLFTLLFASSLFAFWFLSSMFLTHPLCSLLWLHQVFFCFWCYGSSPYFFSDSNSLFIASVFSSFSPNCIFLNYDLTLWNWLTHYF